MSALTMSDLLAAWAAKTQAAVDVYPAVPFDGTTAMPAWLLASARDQAERVFLILDGTPVERRDLGWAENLIEDSGRVVLTTWAELMETSGSGDEPWAIKALEAAAEAYTARLDELGPNIHQGGRA